MVCLVQAQQGFLSLPDHFMPTAQLHFSLGNKALCHSHSGKQIINQRSFFKNYEEFEGKKE